MTYAIRFFAYLSSLNKEDLDLIKDFPVRDIFSARVEERFKTFRDDTRIWFEAEMPFIPLLGMRIHGIIVTTGSFDWNEDIPIVSELTYLMDENRILVELDWGSKNQIALLRKIEKQIRP